MDQEQKRAILNAPLDEKIKQSKRLIMDWYAQFDGQVYISFSGGKDSTVLLHLVRSLYPEVPAVFADTGLEYPEIKEFVRTLDNVEWVKPVFNRKPISFAETIKRFGFPIISKEQALYIEQWRNAKSEKHKDIRWNGKLGNNGRRIGKISEKWKPIAESDIPITQKCCGIFKKSPFKAYQKRTGRKPFTGVMAGESSLRKQKYFRDECNNYDAKNPQSNPIFFWNEGDIWKYLRDFAVEYSKIYDMGYDRTGCMFCMYGTHLEKEGDDRFNRLAKTHPKLYTYCMDKLGLRKVLKGYVNREYPVLNSNNSKAIKPSILKEKIMSTVFNKVGGQKKYYKYKECEKGQVLVEGKYVGRSPNKFGKDNHDFIPSEGGPTVCLNSAGHLDYLMENYVREGQTVQVIYDGKKKLDKGPMKGKESHQFEVLVADGGDSVEPMAEAAPIAKESSNSEQVDLSDLD